jgi:hypothetical protein
MYRRNAVLYFQSVGAFGLVIKPRLQSLRGRMRPPRRVSGIITFQSAYSARLQDTHSTAFTVEDTHCKQHVPEMEARTRGQEGTEVYGQYYNAEVYEKSRTFFV